MTGYTDLPGQETLGEFYLTVFSLSMMVLMSQREHFFYLPVRSALQVS